MTNTTHTFSLAERISIAGIMPQQGSYIDNLLCRHLMRKLELTPHELDEYGLQALPNGMITWNAKGNQAQTPIELTEKELSLLKKALTQCDQEARLPAALTDCYARLCQPDTPSELLLHPKTTAINNENHIPAQP